MRHAWGLLSPPLAYTCSPPKSVEFQPHHATNAGIPSAYGPPWRAGLSRPREHKTGPNQCQCSTSRHWPFSRDTWTKRFPKPPEPGTAVPLAPQVLQPLLRGTAPAGQTHLPETKDGRKRILVQKQVSCQKESTTCLNATKEQENKAKLWELLQNFILAEKTRGSRRGTLLPVP